MRRNRLLEAALKLGGGPSTANDRNDNKRSNLAVDRTGTSFLVPLVIGVVFIALALAWVSMSGRDDSSSPKDVMNRPNAPAGGKTPEAK